MSAMRPTPANPTSTEQAHLSHHGEARALPPQLGPEAVAVVSGSTFMYSGPNGDVPAGTIGGLVHQDTRLLNRWELRLDGQELSVLRSASVDHHLAEFILTNPDLPSGIPGNSLAIGRTRLVDGLLHERIEIVS